MRITILALGTRGDVQPMLALAQALRAGGHTIAFLAGEDNAEWVKRYGFDFHPCVNMQTMMTSDAGLRWMESGSGMAQLEVMRHLMIEYGQPISDVMIEACRGADLVLSGFISEPFAHAICQKYGIRQMSSSLQPYRPTQYGESGLLPIVPRGKSILNRWTGLLGARLLWRVTSTAVNALRERLDLPPVTPREALQIQMNLPTVHGFSPHVVPHAADWPAHVHTVGYWFLDEGRDYQPPPALADFLAAGNPPVYIGFGSMPNRDPQAQIDLMAAAAQRAGVRAIIGTGWSGARAPEVADHVFLLDQAPHDWLFPRMAAVVHHGGAGTTAAGLRSGKPTLIVAHIADQPFWGRRVHQLGVGVKPIRRAKLTIETLAAGLRELTTRTALQDSAQALGQKIRAEDGLARALEIIGKA